MSRPLSRTGSFFLAVLLLTSACGGGDDESAPTTTAESIRATVTAPVSTTTVAVTTTLSDEAAVVEVLKRFESVAHTITDPNDSELEQIATGTALDRLRMGLREQVELGEAVMLPTDSVFSVTASEVEIDGDLAVIVACVVDDRVVTAEDGSIVNDNLVAVITQTDLQRMASHWLVAKSVILSRNEGSKSCVG